MRRTVGLVGLMSLALAFAGCGGDDPEDDDGSDQCADAPSFEEVSAFQVCINCHNSSKTDQARNGAPPTINFDSYEAAAQNADRAAHEVGQSDMPPPSSGFTLTSAQRSALVKWADCGAPR
ncbi:MAG TPA: hypothetical protein VK524_00835 [Polyangiaceae bacterium]|nr:hypothetical protein [Polyangiaceae bacterium]